MRVLYAEAAWADILHWRATDPNMLARVKQVIDDAARQPHRGLGKPTPLDGPLSGWWSRVLSGPHRLIYRAVGEGEDARLEIACARVLRP